MDVPFSPSRVTRWVYLRGLRGARKTWKERLIWKGVRGACLGRHRDGGFGHHEGTQRVQSWTQKGKAMTVTRPTRANDLLSCLGRTRSRFA